MEGGRGGPNTPKRHNQTGCQKFAFRPPLGHPEFPDLIRQFIYNQQHLDNISNTSISDLPMFYGKIMVYSLAVATFHAPGDISGIGGMRHEQICAVKSW